MNGGAYNYAYRTVRDLADEMAIDGGLDAAPPVMRHALRAHLEDLAKVLRAVEWNDSGDGDPDEERLILELLSPTDVLRSALMIADSAKQGLDTAIQLAREELAKRGDE